MMFGARPVLTTEATASATGDILRLEKLTKTYGGHTVLHSIDLSVRNGEFLTLLGPSGCGKTSTLNIVAGLLAPDSGRVVLRGRVANGIPPRRRNIGMVFQSWALFPHMTVLDNVAYGLRARHAGSAEVLRRVGEMLDLVRLGSAAEKYPSQLSGGMQQRVALARALVTRPDLLLLDEPLSNLDAALRKDMQTEIRRIHDELGVSTLLVTHSQEEALVMSDRIAVMRAGRIACLDTPAGVYDNPPNAFVCSFLGDANLLTATVEGVTDGELRLRCGPLQMRAPASGPRQVGEQVALAIRPESIVLAPSTGEGCEATVTQAVFKGSLIAYQLDAQGLILQALALPPPSGVPAGPGTRLRISVPSARVILLGDDDA